MDDYAIVYFLTVKLREINSFRQKYDPQYTVIAPHITLISPFSGIIEEQVIQHFITVTKNIKPLEISLNRLIKSYDNYLFLLVNKGKEELEKVHDKLYSRIITSYKQKDVPFVPHVTLGLLQSEEEQLNNKIYAEAEELNLNFSDNFNKISLIKGNGISPARTVKTFYLK